MHGACAARISRTNNHEQAIYHDMEYHNQLCRILRQILEEEAAKYCGQNRQANQHNKGIQEGLQASREEIYHRADNGGCNGKDNADFLAHRYQLITRSLRIDILMINIHGEHGVNRVQNGVKGRQDCAEHNRRKEAHQRSRDNLCHQMRIGIIHHGYLIALQLKQCIGNNTRQCQEHKAGNLQKGTVQCTLLCFLQVFRSQNALDKRLMGAPGLQTQEYQTGKYRRPRNLRSFRSERTDGVQLICMVSHQILPAINNCNRASAASCMAQYIQCKERDHQTANQQADAVYGIRYSNRLQAAENRINRTYHADSNTKNTDGLELGNAQQTGQVKDIFKYQRTGVQNNRNLYYQIQNNVCDAEPQLGGTVKPQTDQLRNGGNTTF